MITTKDTATQVLVYSDFLDVALTVPKPWADKGMHRAAFVQTNYGLVISPAKVEHYCELLRYAANIAQELNATAGYK